MKSKLYVQCRSSSFCWAFKFDPSGSNGPFLSIHIPNMPFFLQMVAKDLTTFYMYRAQSDNDYAARLDNEGLLGYLGPSIGCSLTTCKDQVGPIFRGESS